MNKMIRLLMLLLVFSAAISCQNNKNQTLIKKLTINLQEGDPPSLNPYLGVDLRSRCLFLALFEPLMRRNCQGGLDLAAAEKVVIDPSQTIYTFHLRPNLWSNGEAVTAYHFEQAWKYALTPKSYCIRADLFYPIKNAEKVKKGIMPIEELGIEVPNDKTLIVHLEHPTAYFLDLVATSFFSPLFNVSEEEPIHFNGPFQLKERVRDQKLCFKKNCHYWDEQNIELEEICFLMVKDPMTAFAMYEKGELDLVGDPFSPLPFDVIPSLENSSQLKSKLISRIFYLLLNTNQYPLCNKSLRRALSLSIDRDQLAEHLFFGEIPSVSSIPTTLSFFNDTEFKKSNSETLAIFEEALLELGLTRDTFPKLIFSYAELSGQKKLAEFIQEQWKKVLGIEILLECAEWNVHMSKIRKENYQIGTLHLTTLFQDPMFYFDLFRDKTSLSNYCRWENDRFKQLLTLSECTTDSKMRHCYLKEAEWLLFEEMPVIGLFTQNLQYLIQDSINLEITDLGIYDFKHAFFKNSTL